MQVGSRRSELDIVQEILKMASGTTAHLRSNANLSHSQMMRYLRFLEGSGLVHLDRNGNRTLHFQVTAKGRQVLNELELLYELFQPESPEAKLRFR